MGYPVAFATMPTHKKIIRIKVLIVCVCVCAVSSSDGVVRTVADVRQSQLLEEFERRKRVSVLQCRASQGCVFSVGKGHSCAN